MLAENLMKRNSLKQCRGLLVILTVCATETWCESAAPLHRREFAVIDIAETAGGNFGWASAVNNGSCLATLGGMIPSGRGFTSVAFIRQ
jgi:hypothetical protein